jgi:D-alanyl-lipoteichoic acid acyltransferase DltB (MBOAT superfamily)
MTYTSVYFAVFVLALFIIYFILPVKIRWVVLLVGSYVFYYISAGIEALSFIVLTTAVVFAIGLAIGKIHDKYKEDRQKSKLYRRLVMTAGLLYAFGVLCYLKYSNFVIEIVNQVTDGDMMYLDLLLPLGISFYTFQLSGYLIDVYRGKFQPDGNIAKFALFACFFPQIIQGPISRYDQLAHQLYEGHKFDYQRIKFGIMLIIWGYFKKLVIADRAAIIVSTMVNSPGDYQGFEVVYGGIAYMIQMYGDFSGGIDISIGVAQIFGITMVQNFNQPYFSDSLNEYWRRWHITLGAWTRDYIFFSISLSKAASRFTKSTKDKIGKYLSKTLPSCFAIGVVFLIIGIWHGASMNYVAFAVYNTVIVMLEFLILPPMNKALDQRGIINRKSIPWKLFTIFITLIIVTISKFFPMSRSLADAMTLLGNMFTSFNPSVITDGSLLEMGLDFNNIILLFLAVAVLFVRDFLTEMGMNMRESIDKRNFIIKGAIILVALLSIVIFGIYGTQVNDTTFIYQQF